jgi:hypothetical protein
LQKKHLESRGKVSLRDLCFVPPQNGTISADNQPTSIDSVCIDAMQSDQVELADFNPPMFVVIGLQILIFDASGLQIRWDEGGMKRKFLPNFCRTYRIISYLCTLICKSEN